MDVHDGFIAGIYNYCDGWCQRCAFTSYCRLFADSAEMDAMLDPGLRMIADAAPLPEEAPPPPPRWLRELIEECDEAAREAAQVEVVADTTQLARRLREEHVPIQERARQYAFSAHDWLRSHRSDIHADPFGACAVVSWFHIKVATKVYRALTGLAEAGHAGVDTQDHIGSAKVALLGIDESHAALLQLIESGRVNQADVNPLVGDLVWLGEALEQVFPGARAFVRPGLDEPDAISRLRDSDHV